ncbi:two-component sensor histidine kinase [Paenibacillus terrae]|uniref:Signal transduction histidine-protein kinase ArlS n=1 Tax=Paenibacillus terrae TaxID=159743 RepID=A0A4U2PTG2_9BACL|nr:HAMP domain-containing histidine kinase [Paenibacillus terrae]TKH41356.1 two-component sensor histidine kinase [Paenibacillus terrae]
MTTLKFIFSRLPIRWKLAVWSSLLLCILFVLYNGVQYFTINQWMISEGEVSIRKSMNEIQNFFQEKQMSAQEIVNSQRFVEDMNDPHQMIRILNQQGTPLLSVSDEMPEDWFPPQTAQSTRIMTAWHLEDQVLIMRSPLNSGGFRGTIEIINNMENLEKVSDKIKGVMIMGGIGAILLSALGGVFLSRQLIRPIQSMTDTMTRIRKKGLHEERVQVSDNNDELSNLGRVFNGLIDQLERSFLQQKQFVEDASHELRTPISIIEGHISLLNRWGKHDPAILDESLSVSVQELERLKGIVNDLLELTRAESGTSEQNVPVIEIRHTVQYTLTNFAMLHPDMIFREELTPLEKVQIHITPQHLEQLLLIVLDNAVKYAGSSKEILVTGTLERDEVYIHITDYGIGIPAEDLPYVFDRFYRVDKARGREQGGTGLGLAIAKQLVKRYNGNIRVSSIEHIGTTVTLCFPIYRL